MQDDEKLKERPFIQERPTWVRHQQFHNVGWEKVTPKQKTLSSMSNDALLHAALIANEISLT